MSPSTARIQANRANAQRSTGPRTAEGKQRSSENAIRHGLTTLRPRIPTEDQPAYQELSRGFIEDLKPLGALEHELVQNIIDLQWRLKRCRKLEESVMDPLNPPAEQIGLLNRFSLYEQRITRNFLATLKQLREIQAARTVQNGFVFSNRPPRADAGSPRTAAAAETVPAAATLHRAAGSAPAAEPTSTQPSPPLYTEGYSTFRVSPGPRKPNAKTHISAEQP